ncbi:MAG: helix-turn-helix domain-containing protein, partial [Nitrospira sp.]|nr:helix-turn-helix domain-containing protein [Nitrospira sp.]
RRILYGSPTEVKSLLQKITGECLVSEKNNAFSQNRIQKQLLDNNEAAHYLGISPKTLPTWVSMRKIPHVKVGRLTKFRVEDLDAWLDRRRKEEDGKEFL